MPSHASLRPLNLMQAQRQALVCPPASVSCPGHLADLPCCVAEMMVKAYMTSYKLPCIITRGNNVYGPHQFPEKLVPKFTLLARRGEALPVHGAGQVLPPWPDTPPGSMRHGADCDLTECWPLEEATPCTAQRQHTLCRGRQLSRLYRPGVMRVTAAQRPSSVLSCAELWPAFLGMQ